MILKNNSKKICLVIPSLQAGGMERVMSQLAVFFAAQQEVEVHLVLYGRFRTVFYEIPESIIVHRPDFVFNDQHRLWSTIKSLQFVRHTIKGINPDTILSFGEYWNSFVLLSLLGTRYPVFVSDRCQPDKKMGTMQTLLRRWLYPKTAGIIAQTSRARGICLTKFHHDNIKVIGNPLKRIATVASDSCTREKIVLSVGRLISTKHHDKLIELFLDLEVPKWKLVIVGGNALKQNNMARLTELIMSRNAQDRIILAGEQSDVEAYYRKSRIFAFTSSSEGFPNVIAEALSAGLPVVSFDCVAGPSEMITDGVNGYLVPLFDCETFKIRLQALMTDDVLCETLAANAVNSLGRFDIDFVGKEYLSFITSVNVK